SDTAAHSGSDTAAHSGSDTAAHSGSDAAAHSGSDTGDPSLDLERAEVPAPVRRYLDAVFEGTPRPASRVRLEQRGEIRLGGRWYPFDATQHVRTSPPGFLWDARVHLPSIAFVRVHDSFVDGDGRIEARFLSAVPVAREGPSPDVNAGELARFLAEAPWYPGSLLPHRGLVWEPIDARTSRATVEANGVRSSLVFHFDDEGLIERVTGLRFRQETGSIEDWVGDFGDYVSYDGRLVPTSVCVAWAHPSGEQPYFRASIEGIDYTI
ncbi:MAG: DUF6544 family protein, partial [Halodesulfurarchaeum sp.]